MLPLKAALKNYNSKTPWVQSRDRCWDLVMITILKTISSLVACEAISEWDSVDTIINTFPFLSLFLSVEIKRLYVAIILLNILMNSTNSADIKCKNISSFMMWWSMLYDPVKISRVEYLILRSESFNKLMLIGSKKNLLMLASFQKL